MYRVRWLSVLLILATLPLGAEVFRTIPGSTAFFGSLRRAYHTAMTINGRKTEVEVFTTEDSYAKTMAGLESVMGGDGKADIRRGTSLATVRINKSNSRSTSYLVSELPDSGKTLVIRSDENTPIRRTEQAPEHRMTVAPAYPGSTPTFHAHDKGTGMEVQISESTDPSPLIMQHYDMQLRSSGWAPPLPMDQLPSQPGLSMYTRGNYEIMCVSAQRDSYRRTSTITLLHKQRSVR